VLPQALHLVHLRRSASGAVGVDQQRQHSRRATVPAHASKTTHPRTTDADGYIHDPRRRIDGGIASNVTPMNFKIIATDNLNRETVSESVVAENIYSSDYADVMVKALNDKFCTSDLSPAFFKKERQDYKPYKFEP
jgi:hypothetical protein